MEKALAMDGVKFKNRNISVIVATTTGTVQAEGTHTPAMLAEARQLRHPFQPFPADFSAPPHPTRAMCYALLRDQLIGCWLVLGAWDPML